jgi:hypothetical protein
MRKLANKKSHRILSDLYLDKISGILHARWAETQQAIAHKDSEARSLQNN